ncbi:MAG TPA: hypothetical protein VME22_06510 [Solirubrobacteraceae bacterium]|nr:hypothetical protein [Solirubrobacteraceae bacterium]
MYTITIPNPHLRSEDVVQALRDGLGPGFNVLPGMRVTRAPFSQPVPGSDDTVAVGTKDNRVWRAQVSIVREPGRTELRITPGGLISDYVLNALWTARKTRRALSTAPGLARPA